MAAPLLPALTPRGPGHQFVCYADACSGVAGALHAQTFAAVNQVMARLDPPPAFICFPGDEIIGLSADDDELRRQWRYWLDVEMAWLDRALIPFYHTTGNHTTYDAASTAIFREMLAHLPQNGAPGQAGLSYWVRRDDLLLIFVHTLPLELGGEGYVETAWLAATLAQHADARYKLVFGHHPVFPVNGFTAAYQREIEPQTGTAFWQLLAKHGVLAYWCSHILAFDVQVHAGVLQILTAGAGTAHRMPEGIEYLHAVQAALDEDGLRYQVLDVEGQVREWLQWPLPLPTVEEWQPLTADKPQLKLLDSTPVQTLSTALIVWQFSGRTAGSSNGSPQTLLSGWDTEGTLAPIWIGLQGTDQHLAVLLAPQPGRSPHLWTGPTLPTDRPFTIQLAFHFGMGPGGLLWRWDEGQPWSSLTGASAWGVETIPWPTQWALGHGQRGATDRPFRGDGLQVLYHHQQLSLHRFGTV